MAHSSSNSSVTPASKTRSQTPPRRGLSAAARRTVAAVALGACFLSTHAAYANTQLTVVNGKTDLTAAATYNPAVAPTSASDIIFGSGIAYSPATFTVGSATNFGTLNDLTTTALTINGTAALTLNGGGDTVGPLLNSLNFVSPTDLFYVAPGGSLTYNGTGGIVLNGTGNFDIASSNFNGSGALSGAATINSIISGGFALTKTGTGTLTLTAANTYTGATNVVQGNLTLNFAAAGAPTTNIIAPTSALTLGGYTTSGGGSLYAPTEGGENPTLLATGISNTATSQTFGSFTANAGTDQLIARGNGTGSMTVALGAITANAGSAVNFSRNGTGGTGVGIFTTGSANDTSGILGGWAVTNATAANQATFTAPTDYATVSGSNIVAYTGYNAQAAGAITGTTTTNDQVTATSATALTVASGTTDINTLSTKSTSNNATTVTIATGGTLRFGANGGILLGSTNSSATLAISGGSVTAGGSATTNNPGTLNLQLNQEPEHQFEHRQQRHRGGGDGCGQRLQCSQHKHQP